MTEDAFDYKGVSHGHFIFGKDIAFGPNDTDHDIDLFAHEFGHTYQSRISGPGYYFKYGLPSAFDSDLPEDDANYRAFEKFGIKPFNDPTEVNRMKWWEFFTGPLVMVWPCIRVTISHKISLLLPKI